MNTDWSTYVQGVGTLHLSRSLRFADIFRDKYREAFAIKKPGSILEIGCGTGALAKALHRWYPGAAITAMDRDTAFIEFARKQAPEITFQEADAARPPYADHTFDVTISNTVAEHIPPQAFFGEQYRVLRPGGVCIVLSARRGISVPAPCVAKESDFEKEIWQRVEDRCAEMEKKVGVCQYPMNEREYPLCMEKYGFRNVSTEYITINLTPDDPVYSPDMGRAMINAEHQTRLDAINSLKAIAPDLVSHEERVEMRRLINQKYNRRMALYDAGIKQWDTSVSVTMVMRGTK